MKKKERNRQARIARSAFIRGMIATGILAAAESKGRPLSRKAIRRALKSGFAVAGGTIVADALERDDPVKAVITLVGGIIGAAAVDGMLAAAGHEQEQVEDGKEEIG